MEEQSSNSNSIDAWSSRYAGWTASPMRLRILQWVMYASLGGLLFALLYSVFHEHALPPDNRCYDVINQTNHHRREQCSRGTIFGIYAVPALGMLFGAISQMVKLPPLFGMLIAGIVLRNLPAPFTVAAFINEEVAAALRNAAFTVILIQGGLSLDVSALRKLKGTCLRLALLPCLAESLSSMIMVHLVFGYPLLYGLLLGFVLGAVSPAVCVPAMVKLTEEGRGVKKGIPTLVMASSSIDDVIALTGFTLVLAVIFAEGSLLWTIVKSPLELIGGILVGVIAPLLILAMPLRHDMKDGTVLRFAALLLVCLLEMFGSSVVNAGGAGAIAVLVTATILHRTWSTVYGHQAFSMLWSFPMEPLMFGLIGAQLDLHSSITPSSLAQCLLVLVVGLVLRTAMAYFAVLGGGLTWRERVYVSLAWLPKATVQAALAPIFLDSVRRRADADQEMHEAGVTVVSIAVLSILVTAPLGACLMSVTAPSLLEVQDDETDIPLKEIDHDDTIEQ